MTRKQMILLGILLMATPIFFVTIFDAIGFSLTDNGEFVRVLAITIILIFIFSGVILVCLAYYLFRKKANRILNESFANRQEEIRRYRDVKKKV